MEAALGHLIPDYSSVTFVCWGVRDNPINFTDPTGKRARLSWGRANGNRFLRDMAGGLKWAAKNIDPGARWLLSGGTYRSHKGGLGGAAFGLGLAPALLGAAGAALGLGVAAVGLGATAALGAATLAVAGGTALAGLGVAAVAGASVLAVSACMMLVLPCTGYLAGGLGGSSLNHLVWDERAARAGAFLGTAIAAVAGAVIAGVVFGPEVLAILKASSWAGWLWKVAFEGYTWLDLFSYGGLLYAAVTGDLYAFYYGIIPNNPIPFFVAEGLYATGEGIKERYESML